MPFHGTKYSALGRWCAGQPTQLGLADVGKFEGRPLRWRPKPRGDYKGEFSSGWKVSRRIYNPVRPYGCHAIR
jgi:hypothetical protein